MKFKPRKVDNTVIEMEGWVDIETPYQKQRAKNTILLQGLAQYWWVTAVTGGSAGSFVTGSYYVTLGTDLSTPTTISTTGLASPLTVSTIPLINGSNLVFSLVTDSTTYWGLLISTQYPASSFTTTLTIGELGFYSKVNSTATTNIQSSYPVNGIFSRLAVADGTMSSITVNGSTYLNIQWTIQMKFGG